MTKIYLPIRIILADDHEIFRDGFNIMISKQNEIELIGEAGNGRELLQITKALQPDIIITDIKMPLMDGIEATKILSAEFPGIGVIALSMFDEDNLVVDMLEAGAKGYLIKNAPKHEILEAVRTVYNQGTYYCHHTSNRLAQMIAKSKFNPYKKKNKIHFTERETDIIKLICAELSSKEMANQLNVSARTIEGHRDNILKKIDAKNLAGIVVYAIKNGIYKP
jgi:DNA-binding NarL/FixJ family response regulator